MSAQIITFACVLKNHAGKTIGSSMNRDVLTSLPQVEGPLHGLTTALQNLKAGEKRRIRLSAQDAYGPYDPQKSILIPRRRLLGGSSLRVGQATKLLGKNGQTRAFTVLKLFKDMAQVDGNHPLAGQDLDFEIEALSVREATPAEITEAVNPVSLQVLHL